MKPRLVLFTKAPVIGGAKSRLAAGIGKVHAWRIYRAMLAGLTRRLRDPRWDLMLAVAPDQAAARRFAGVWPADLARLPQGDGDLGDRQARVFSWPAPTVVIGADAPQITRADIAAAIRALKRHDAVIGPAEDGGYWLLGLNAPAPVDLFDGVRWSHGRTRADLEARMAALGLTQIHHLRTLRDVDEAEDLKRSKTH